MAGSTAGVSQPGCVRSVARYTPQCPQLLAPGVKFTFRQSSWLLVRGRLAQASASPPADLVPGRHP